MTYRNLFLRILPFMYILMTISLAQAVRLTACITDAKGKAVEDAIINDGQKWVFSDHDGRFSISTNADSLLITRLGYEKKTVRTSALTPVVVLTARPYSLPMVRVVERYSPTFNTALDKTSLSIDTDKAGASINEDLLKESSINTFNTFLTGESKPLSLLGNLGRHTLVVLDNVPLNPQGEAVDVSTLPLEDIRRLEIVKGSSSLYGGSSAIGGIIYLFTHDKQEAHTLKLKQETSFGSFGMFSHSYAAEQQSWLLSTRVSISNSRADNDFPYTPRPWWNLSGNLTRTNNRKEQQNISFSLLSMLKDVSVQYRLDEETIYRELPGPVNFLSIYDHAYLTGQNLKHNLHLNYNKFRDYKDNLILWQNADYTEYNNTRAANPVYLTNYRQSQSSAGIRNDFEYYINRYATYNLTTEYTRQSYALKDLVNSSLPIEEIVRNQGAVALKVQLGSDIFFFEDKFQAGVRRDITDLFGDYTSWRGEALIKLDGEVQCEVSAAVGTGFSLPSFYDLYWKGDAQSLGNPELKSETSLSGNLSLKATYRSYSLQAAYHKSEIRELIQWRQTYLYGTVWKPVNIGKARLENWEFNALGQPFTWLKGKSSLTLTEARDLDLDANLTYTPEYKWVNDVTLYYSGLEFNVNAISSGRQWTTPDNLIAPLPALTLFNSALHYNLEYHSLKLGFALNLNNLFDKQSEIYAYVPQPGFNWTGGISLHYER